MPKKCRALCDRIDGRIVDIIELVQIASFQKGERKIDTLERASRGIDTVKLLLRVAWEVKALDNKKYEVISVEMDTAGKQVGGWKKGIQKTPDK